MSPSTIFEPICWSPPRGPLEPLDHGALDLLLQVGARRPRRVELVVGPSNSRLNSPTRQVRFLLSWATSAIFLRLPMGISIWVTGPSNPWSHWTPAGSSDGLHV